MTYIVVLVCKSKTGRRFFTYETNETISPGNLVEIPFGRQKLPGIVIDVVKKPSFKTKPLAGVFSFALPKINLKLLGWMLDFYPDDFSAIGNQFLPTNLKVKNPQVKQPKIVQGNNEPLQPATIQQQKAIAIMANSQKVILSGVTGSGKTRVFTEQIRNILNNGKSVLVITPEIGLTPQLISDIKKYVNSPVIVNHSLLTPAEKRRIWDYALSEPVPTVYVGPRSNIFIPSPNIGLIVIDEFHDQSLKQQNTPRYQTLHIASYLSALHKCQLILSSATPSVSDFQQMKTAGFKVAKMDQLAVAQIPAEGHIIDSNDRQLFTKSQYLSDIVIENIAKHLSNQEQVMLFINRRGTARLVKCNNCGWQALCDKCGLPMTYHHDIFTLFCHSCGQKKPAPKSCPHCGSLEISFKSIGTKALVEHTQKLFPKAKIVRFDADSSAENKLHRNIDALKNNESDIIIGTQILSKGIDLPNLGMVAVVNADAGLALPDFSSEETLFQQLYQVTGRVGRGHRASQYFIQTQNPHNPVMEAVLTRDYQAFYEYEINKRKIFKYPPFCFLALVKITKKSTSSAEKLATKIANQLLTEPNLVVLGPSPSFYEKTANGYVWQIVIKSLKRSSILQALSSIEKDVVVDIDPTSLL